jgi:DNA invertase Pin-like site-specific DNA recombinase
MAVYGYARCSTTEIKQDVERQTRELRARGAKKVYSEYVSGTASVKPVFEELLSIVKPGDTIAVTEVSRLGRDVHQLCHVLECAQEHYIKIDCGVLQLDYSTDIPVDSMSRAMFLVSGVFAEVERGVTVERIKSGIAAAREKGVSVGRPKKTADDVPSNVKELLPDYVSGKISMAEYARLAGVSRQVMYKYLRLLDVETKGARIITPVSVPQKVRQAYESFITSDMSIAEFARSMNVTRDTMRRYIELLKG